MLCQNEQIVCLNHLNQKNVTLKKTRRRTGHKSLSGCLETNRVTDLCFWSVFELKSLICKVLQFSLKDTSSKLSACPLSSERLLTAILLTFNMPKYAIEKAVENMSDLNYRPDVRPKIRCLSNCIDIGALLSVL